MTKTKTATAQTAAIMLVGNLGKEVEMRAFDSGKVVAKPIQSKSSESNGSIRSRRNKHYQPQYCG